MLKIFRCLAAGWLALAVLIPFSALAQNALLVQLAPPVTDRFPSISLYLTVSDASGRPVTSLPQSSFSISEDDRSPAINEFESVQVGTQLEFVLNSSAAMKIRDSRGRTRFTLIQQALGAWLAMPAVADSQNDDFSLLTASGPLVSHTHEAGRVATALNQFAPVFSDQDPGYDLLIQALDMQLPGTTAPAMVKSIVFITGLIENPSEVALANVLAQAKDSNTRINVVLLGPPDLLALPKTSGLQRLASETGGSFELFDPAAGLAPLADRTNALGSAYRLSYTSRLTRAGSHTVVVNVASEGLTASSQARTFELDVRLPEVTFVDPPGQIERHSSDPAVPLSDLPPAEQKLRILVTFPDGHGRPLASSRLLVDSVAVGQNQSAPFDQFTWDLTGLLESGHHVLRAEVTDSLGLTAASSDVGVEVLVVPPPGGMAALRPALIPLLAAIGVLLAGVILAVSLLGVRRQTGAAPSLADRQRSGFRSPMRRAAMQSPTPEIVEAMLVPVDSQGVELGSPLPLIGTDVILGRDASLATLVFADPSVSAMHARLIRQADGSYIVKDQGSTAGTWVNYSVAPDSGYRLQHDDILHIGRIALRFQVSGSPPARQVKVTVLDAQQENGPQAGQEPGL
jgi:hypothetical protein